jgi:hypothetical protein
MDSDGVPVLVTGPHLAHPEDLETAVEGYARFDRVDATAISAASLGLLADRMRTLGRPFAAAGTEAAQPLYLRAPDVTPSPGPKRVTG